MQTILFYFINIVGISQILSYVRRKSNPWLGKKINHTTTNTTICGGCKQFYCKFSTTFLFLIFQISLLKSTSNLNILTSLFPTKTKEKKKRKKRREKKGVLTSRSTQIIKHRLQSETQSWGCTLMLSLLSQIECRIIW